MICGLLLCSILSNALADDGRAYLGGPSLSGSIKVKSWKTLRDERVVKQDLDYSCGAASLATVLNEHYGQAVTEQDLLRGMNTGDLMASFEDMQQALLKFGFRAVGISASYDQLARLNMPGIVYLEHRKTEHFSVLRGIDRLACRSFTGEPHLQPVAILGYVGHANRHDRKCRIERQDSACVPRRRKGPKPVRLLYQDTKATNGPGGKATPGFA